MNDIETFKDDLERQLVAAAQKRIDGNGLGWPAQRSRSPVLLAAAACVIVGLLVASIGALRPTDATAQVFAISKTEDSVVIRVVDLIADPDATVTELRDGAGVNAEVMAVPSDPQLVGLLGVAGSTGTVTPQAVPDVNGVIETIILPPGFNGTLILEYGRKAEPAEEYNMTTSSPLCADYLDHQPMELLQDIPADPDQVRFEQFDTKGVGIVDADPNTIPPDYQLLDLVAMSDHSFLATYVQTLENWVIHPNCQ